MPKYATIADDIRSRIHQGEYADGMKLPIENDMMQAYDVSRQTIRKAMDVLEGEGIVLRRRGSGTFVRRHKSIARTGVVGLIATDISGEIPPQVLRGMERALTKEGYAMVLRSTRNHVDNERQMLAYFLDNPVDGLIIDGTKTMLPSPNIDLFKRLMDGGTPMVFINAPYRELPDCVCVTMDDEGGAATLTNYLIDSGCRRIGGLFQIDYEQGLRRYAGYTRALVRAGLPIIDQHIIWFSNETKNTELAEYYANDMFEPFRDLDGFICQNDLFSRFVIRLYRIMLGKIPRVVGFDDILTSPFPQIDYVTLPHPKDAMGALAARKLLALIRGESAVSEVVPWGAPKHITESDE